MIKNMQPSPEHEQNTSAQREESIDLLKLWSVVMKGKWIIVGFTILFSAISVLYALSLPNMYKSTAVVAPADSSNDLASMAGQLSGLASSLAGISFGVGVGGSNKMAEAMEILQSWAFIEEFIHEQNNAPEVFAVKGWDQETNELIYNNDLYDPGTQVWTREPPRGKSSAPSSWELFERFKGFIEISEDKSSGFTQLSVEYYSPEIAKRWVDALIKSINTKLQTRDAEESQRNVQFLKLQIEETELASMHSVFYDLIEEQTKALMLAKGSSEYVLKTISESRISEKKSKPQRALICVLGALCGGMLGIMFSLLIHSKTTAE